MKILETNDSAVCTKNLKIEVTPEEVDAERGDVYQQFMAHAEVPGFRKGKAPKKILRMRYGKHIDKEAIGKAVEKALREAFEEMDLRPVGEPEITEMNDSDPNQPVTFEARVEYIPPFELASYHDIEPQPPSTEVTEKEIDETLDRLRSQNATQVSVDDRPASEGDNVTIACEATIDGETFQEATHDEIPIELGSKRYIPGFEEELTGLQLNEQKTFSLTLPDDYPEESRRGKEAHFSVTVKQIQETRLPELDDEFAKDMGDFESLDDLKERIRQDLENNKVQQQQQEVRNQIRDELLNRNPIDVPPTMVKGRYNYIMAMQEAELQRMGRTVDDMIKEDENFLSRNEKAAEDQVRLSLILEKIADEENIAISDEEFMQYIQQIAMQSGMSPQMFLERLQQNNVEEFYRRQALEEKTLSTLAAKAGQPAE